MLLLLNLAIVTYHTFNQSLIAYMLAAAVDNPYLCLYGWMIGMRYATRHNTPSVVQSTICKR